MAIRTRKKFRLSKDGAFVSKHSKIEDAIEAAAEHAEQFGDGSYDIDGSYDVRTFFRAKFVAEIKTTAALVDPGGLTTPPQTSASAPPPVNNPPTIVSTPSPSFVESAANQYNLDQHMSDPDGDQLRAVLNTGTVALPSGVTLQAQPDNNALIYDGVGVPILSTGHTLTADDLQAQSSASDAFTIAITTATPTLGKRWNPGHYTRPQGDPFDMTQADFLALMQSKLAGETQDIPELLGAMFPIPWGWVNPTGSTFDWNFLDTMINQASAQGQSILVMLMHKSFGNAGTFTVQAPADLVASGGVSSFSGGSQGGNIARLWDSDVADRFIACMEAIGARYDSNESFEGILTNESTGSQPDDPTYSTAAYGTQWRRIYTGMEGAFPKANVFPQINSLAGELTNLFEHCFNLRIGISGPDARETQGWEFFAGRDSNPGGGSNETPPRVYRKQLARGITVSRSAFTPIGRTADEIIDLMQTDQDVTHAFWITQNIGPGQDWVDTKAAIQADPNLWTTCPTRYLSCAT